MSEKQIKYIKRDMEDVVLELTKEYSCIFIGGPRQAGKSTMLKKIMTPDRHVVTLDDLNERHIAKTDPEMLLNGEFWSPPTAHSFIHSNTFKLFALVLSADFTSIGII